MPSVKRTPHDLEPDPSHPAKVTNPVQGKKEVDEIGSDKPAKKKRKPGAKNKKGMSLPPGCQEH